jgi:peptidoglycan/xylan/chitin deacetylase (PgdA/CDA1 family)
MREPGPAVCYHAISDTWHSDLAVTEAQFEQQIRFFARRGYQGVTFTELERARVSGIGSRAVAITFDDGFRSVLRAQPILSRYEFRATVFVVTSFVSTEQLLTWPGLEVGSLASPDELLSLTWDDCRDLQRHGWEIGSHTVSHPVLPDLGDEALGRELKDSRASILGALGECRSLAYPFGHADERVARAAAAAGYESACTLGFATSFDGPLLRPRVGVVRSDSFRRMRLKAHPLTNAIRSTPLAQLAEHAGISRGRRRPH